jgi:hypothetical protein
MKKLKIRIMVLFGNNNLHGGRLTPHKQIFYFGMMRKEFFILD